MHNKYTYKKENIFNIHDYNCKKRNIVKINADQSNCLHTGVDGLERSEGAGLE